MTTYYIATSRHGDQRTYHCDDGCPALDRATGVTTRERDAIPEDRACPRCVDPDPEWNQGDDNDWGYQRALAREAGVDSEIVTDGGTIDACPECEAGAIERRTPAKAASPSSQTNRWYCRKCQTSFDEPVEREPKKSATSLSGTVAALDAADPDAIPDGGVPDPDAFDIPTVADLDAIRVAKGLSQRDLSRRAGCEQSRFNTILNKDIDPHVSTIRAFLTVLQEAEPRDDDEIERTGPKPSPSPNADRDPDEFELLSAQLDHSPPDAVGEDPRPPERDRDDGLRSDGGETLRSKAEMNTGRLSVAGVVGWPKAEKEYVDLGEELDDELPEPDRAEHERRARQSATSVAAWSRRAGVDPRAVIDEAWAELSRDGDDEGGHYCEICERPFETIAALITHDCEEQDGPLVTDGGVDIGELSEEEISAVVNTRMFQKALAYRRLADGISVLEDEDQVFESLVTSITKQHSQVRSEDSTREFFRLFREEVETFTEELTDADENGGDASDLRDLVDGRGDR
jgi:transcriptional regulator with XRE-family HTH domain